MSASLADLPSRGQVCYSGQCQRAWRVPICWRTEPRRQHSSRRPVAAATAAGILPDVLAVLTPGVCFTKACQEEADKAFLVAVSIPIIIAVAAAYYIARPPPKELKESGRVFEDVVTGTIFDAPEGVQPLRDKDGALAFKPVSYTPWPVPEDHPGEQIRIPVGPIKDKKPRTFVFDRLLPQPSKLVVVSLPRPLGVVFEFDERQRRIVAVGCIEGGNAEQRQKVAAINTAMASNAVLEGDVLRACTATNFVYPTRALFGAVAPERHIVVYGADKQSWGSVRAALRKGVKSDGDVTLVLERRCEE